VGLIDGSYLQLEFVGVGWVVGWHPSLAVRRVESNERQQGNTQLRRLLASHEDTYEIDSTSFPIMWPCHA
jgi:hypothetical protein